MPLIRFKVSSGDRLHRRFTLPSESTLSEFVETLKTLFDDNLPAGPFFLQYVDEEGDDVVMETQSEWEEAIRVYLSVVDSLQSSSSTSLFPPFKVKIVPGGSRQLAQENHRSSMLDSVDIDDQDENEGGDCCDGFRDQLFELLRLALAPRREIQVAAETGSLLNVANSVISGVRDTSLSSLETLVREAIEKYGIRPRKSRRSMHNVFSRLERFLANACSNSSECAEESQTPFADLVFSSLRSIMEKIVVEPHGDDGVEDQRENPSEEPDNSEHNEKGSSSASLPTNTPKESSDSMEPPRRCGGHWNLRGGRHRRCQGREDGGKRDRRPRFFQFVRDNLRHIIEQASSNVDISGVDHVLQAAINMWTGEVEDAHVFRGNQPMSDCAGPEECEGDMTLVADVNPDGSLENVSVYPGRPKSETFDASPQNQEEILQEILRQSEEEIDEEERRSIEAAVERSLEDVNETVDEDMKKSNDIVDEASSSDSPLQDDDSASIANSEDSSSSNMIPSMNISTSSSVVVSGLPNAVFVADIDLDDGSIVAPHLWMKKTWRIGNPSSSVVEWPQKCFLRFLDGSVLEGCEGIRVVCPSSLPPGRFADFSLRFRTPSESGDYKAYFRLYTPDGLTFGPRVWISIRVEDPNQSMIPAKEEGSLVVSTEAVAEHEDFQVIDIDEDDQSQNVAVSNDRIPCENPVPQADHVIEEDIISKSENPENVRMLMEMLQLPAAVAVKLLSESDNNIENVLQKMFDP